MRRLGDRKQRTLRRPAEVRGVGFLTGADVTLRFLPAPACTGVVFVRADLGASAIIPAHISQVTGTARRTTLGTAPLQVSLVEHVLAALAGLKIDNCRVELNALEPPGLDGSAHGFVEALLAAGTQLQPATRPICGVEEPVTVEHGRATLTLYPPTSDELKITYFLDYGFHPSLGRQTRTEVITTSTFLEAIARCRTFLLEEETAELRRQGLGRRTTPRDVLIFGQQGVIDNRLRFADEPARHKILDIVGDLSLLGVDLRGHIVACRSGHELNAELSRTLVHRLPQSGGLSSPHQRADAPRSPVAA